MGSGPLFMSHATHMSSWRHSKPITSLDQDAVLVRFFVCLTHHDSALVRMKMTLISVRSSGLVGPERPQYSFSWYWDARHFATGHVGDSPPMIPSQALVQEPTFHQPSDAFSIHQVADSTVIMTKAAVTNAWVEPESVFIWQQFNAVPRAAQCK